MRISVSVVTHQSAAHVERCLDAVREQGTCVGEVLVADSGSRDDTVLRARRADPEARIAVLGRNAGYAAAHNHNFRRSRHGSFLVLNPDVVLHRGHLDALLERLECEASLAAAGGRLLSPGRPLRLDSAGVVYDRLRTRFVDRGRGLPARSFLRDEDVLGTCGAATLFRRAALEDVSSPGEEPFAERLFMYYEDVDLAWRLRRAGWRIRFCPDAVATHARGGSGGGDAFAEYHLVRNRLWVTLRNAAPRELARELPGLALFELAKSIQSVRRPHLRRALRDQWRGVPESLRARRRAARGA